MSPTEACKAKNSTKVLIVGGSYAGLAAALNLSDLCSGKPSRGAHPQSPPEAKPQPALPVEIKILDERDGFYHLIGSPLALASESYSAKAWQKFEDIPAFQIPTISWTHGSAVKVDSSKKTAMVLDSKSGEQYEEKYDYLVAASGLRRVWPVVPQSTNREKYLAEAKEHIDLVKNARHGVVVIGGGAVGVEMAAEIKLVYPDQTVTLIHSRDKLLSSEPLTDFFKGKSLAELKETGVEVVLSKRVNEINPVEGIHGRTECSLTLSDGTTMQAGHVISAISKSIPSASFLPKDALNAEGLVKITPTLNFPPSITNPTHHFAVGDMVAWSGIKRCGGAMAMGHSAAVNIHQQMLHSHFGTEPRFTELEEYPPMIALAVGKTAVVYDPQGGTRAGEEWMARFFGHDLGLEICWNILGLGIVNSKETK